MMSTHLTQRLVKSCGEEAPVIPGGMKKHELRGNLPFIFWISLIIVWIRTLSSVLVTAVQREMKKLEWLEKQETAMIKGLEK